jgi:hypothetical protein
MSFGSRSIRSGRMPGAGTSPTVPSARPIGRFLGSAGGASNRHSRIGEGCSSLCACGPKVGSRSKCEELNVRKSGPLYSTSKNPRECTGEPLRNAGIGAGALSRRQSRQTTHLPYPAVSRPTRHGRRLLAHRYRCIAGFGKPFAWQIMGSRPSQCASVTAKRSHRPTP